MLFEDVWMRCPWVGCGGTIGGSKIFSAVGTLARCHHEGCVEGGVRRDLFLRMGTCSGPLHLSRRLVMWMGTPLMMV